MQSLSSDNYTQLKTGIIGSLYRKKEIKKTAKLLKNGAVLKSLR